MIDSLFRWASFSTKKLNIEHRPIWPNVTIAVATHQYLNPMLLSCRVRLRAENMLH